MMHGAPEVGGANSTNWHTYSVPEVWSMLEDFDTNPQWRHVGGWRKTFELTGLHLRRMRSYRDQLATAWPPERNEASRVYVAELDKLIASVQATYDAAVANHEAMSAATAAISSARFKLKPIYDRWQAHASAMADYEANVATAKSGTPVPVPEPPPLPPDWQESLNAEARAVMNSTSNEIALASYRLTSPPMYTAPQANSREKMPSDFATGSELAPPVIPRIAPRPASSTSPTRPSAPDGPIVASALLHRDPPAMSAGPGTPGRPPSTTAPASGIGGAVPVGLLPAAPARARIGYIIRPTTQPPAAIIRGMVTAPNGSTAPKVTPRPMPPGGVIGATPAIGLGQAGGRSVQRVNPVGGIISGAAPSGAAGPFVRRSASTSTYRTDELAGSRYRTADGHLVAISGLRGQRKQPRDIEGWDPDNPWATEEGVMPVIEPTAAPTRYDPGPVIGLNQ